MLIQIMHKRISRPLSSVLEGVLILVCGSIYTVHKVSLR